MTTQGNRPVRGGHDRSSADQRSGRHGDTTTALNLRSDASAPGPSRLRVVAVGAGLYALSGPGQTAGFSVFVDPVTAALDLSRGQLTGGYLVATLLAAPSGIWLGRQLDRRNIGTVIRFVGLGLATALCVVAASPALWMLTIGILGLRLFGQTGFTLTSSVHVARTISHRRGTALGALAATGGAAITVTPLVASRLIPLLGWRQTWLLLGAVVIVVAHLLAIAASHGRDHAGAATTSAMSDRRQQAGDAAPPAHFGSLRQRSAFLVIASGYATTAGVTTALGFHQIAILEERGLTARAAAANFLPQSVAAAAVALTVGRIVDRVNGRLVVPCCMTLLATALLALQLVATSATAIVYGVVLGSAAAAIGASEGTLLARWMGTERLGRVRGTLMASVVAASAVGPLLLTVLADAIGSYTGAAATIAALPVTVGTVAVLAPLPEQKLR